MILLIIIGSVAAYLTAGAFVCGVFDDFLYIERYLLFWPVMAIINIIKKAKD